MRRIFEEEREVREMMRGRRLEEIPKQNTISRNWTSLLLFSSAESVFFVLDIISSSAYILFTLHAALILVKKKC